MRDLNSDELSRLAGHSTETMQDECVILETAADEEANQYGLKKNRFVEGPTTRCGYSRGGNARELLGQSQVTMRMPTMRLPLDTTIRATYRLRLTKRYGQPLQPPITYDIIGRPVRGLGAIVVGLSLVTDGSDEQPESV